MQKRPRRIRLDWIPLDTDFIGGRKSIALGVATQNPLAWSYVVRLWVWAAENARDGVISGPDAVAVIENAAGWSQSPGDLVRCMVLPHIRLLDETGSGFRIHDWHEHTGRFIVAAEKKAADNAARQKKWREDNGLETPESQPSNALHNAPVTHECPHREGEGKGEGYSNSLSLTDEGAKARADIIASVGPRPHPQLDATVAALREAGLAPVHPKPDMRAAVEAAIVKVGRDAAVQRIRDAWNPATPHLGWYLSEILGQAKKETGGKAKSKGMATPSKDWTSKEATEF